MSDQPKFEVPTDMRAFAEQSVAQAKRAFETFITATQKAVSTAEGHAATARAGARDVAELSMRNAEKNIAASFDFAQKLVRATTPQEVMQLQTDYVKAQIQQLTEQAKDMVAVTGKAGPGMS